MIKGYRTPIIKGYYSPFNPLVPPPVSSVFAFVSGVFNPTFVYLDESSTFTVTWANGSGPFDVTIDDDLANNWLTVQTEEQSASVGVIYETDGQRVFTVTVADSNRRTISHTYTLDIFDGRPTFSPIFDTSTPLNITVIIPDISSGTNGAGPPYTLSISWGDGSSNYQDLTFDPTMSPQPTHVYGASGDYSVVISVTDQANGQTTVLTNTVTII